jgi:putative CRISPR-associated protein (TIGR02619 family)
MPTQPHTLICTVGTSLLTNLSRLSPDTPNSPTLQTALQQQNWIQLATALAQQDPQDRLCGAEINSINDLLSRGYCQRQSRIILCHSDTPQGQQVAQILSHYYKQQDHPTETEAIPGLQDQNPREFRTLGLRNLVKVISKHVQTRSAAYCAINATGGYKAQIALAAIIGQALQIPVYYKHERFSEIIAFPPMPISLDFELWLAHSGWMMALDRDNILPWNSVADHWHPALDTLIERVTIDGTDYIELSPTGQIFHTTFCDRYHTQKDRLLPPPALPNQKQPPRLTNHSWGNARDKILAFMNRILDECPYVIHCRTHYWNPDLSTSSLFRLQGETDIEAVYSNKTWTVKFILQTTGTAPSQRDACIYDLNRRLESWL